MSNEIVPRLTLGDRMTYAKALAASNLLPQTYQKHPENVLVAMEYGDALGLAPMVAIQQISVIQGKPTMSAQLMGALVRKAGHRLRVIVHDNGAVEAQIVRADDPEFTFRAVWTMERAKSAGLGGKGSWSTYPLAMLKARAITEVCRDACPEVLAGVAYSAEELEPSGPATVSVAHLAPQQPEVVDTDTGEIVPLEDTVDAEILEPGEE